MNSQIKSLADVEKFAKTLIAEGTSFHPDDDFCSYVNERSELVYTRHEGEWRNRLMENSFSVCDEEGVDIYSFMLEIYLKETGLDKFIPLPSQP